ncbi:MurR/RpiR family transcriptional regulator [Streptomyces sp. NPDC050400]|uniref:MurR/RpiR family transcriptional regulator n=1 Tax=Streptomyces sp. NPDC050400 TaxID=3365610 RepID=UPI0037A8B70C
MSTNPDTDVEAGADTDPEDSLRARVESRLPGMPPAERRVAEYLRDHAQAIIFATAEEIGQAVGTSDATVVRTSKNLGYSGLPDLKRSIGQQMIHGTAPSVRLNQRIDSAGQETATLLGHVFSEAGERLAETWRLTPREQFDQAVELLAGAREVVAFGLGLAEIPARFLSMKLTRLGRPARLVGAAGFLLADGLLALRDQDVVVIYAPARLTTEIDVLLDHARSVGARSILITDSLGSTLADRVTVVLPAVHSATGYTAEGFSSLLVTDCLLLGVAAQDRERSTTGSELLRVLRAGLASEGSRRGSGTRRRSSRGEA